MDDIVKQAMAKWPNVPDCYGWLGLDARGQWSMRDDATQAAGSFASGAPGAKGSVLQHDKLIDFIGRNYACDSEGQWFFQNGPQRVYVELEATPWIWRIDSAYNVTAHTGKPVAVESCWMDEHGWVYLQTALGFGLVHTLDTQTVAQAIEKGIWELQETQRSTLAQRYRYALSPQQRHAERGLLQKQ